VTRIDYRGAVSLASLPGALQKTVSNRLSATRTHSRRGDDGRQAERSGLVMPPVAHSRKRA